MNNKEFIAELSQRSGYNKNVVQNFVRTAIEAMGESFDKGESVQIPSFGTFEVKKRLERILVNPSTGQRMMVPPKLVLNFRPTGYIKDRLKNGEIADE
ncbi:MAG: HU family DNA-binding protein [Prevotella sp.]|nr:HU family DNA-binding protein [Prevotella sp.]